MSKKEYEMDDDYRRAAAFLVEQIAERDEYAEKLKLLPLEARPEGLRLLTELDQAIERGEQALAKEYDSFQEMRRLEEDRDKTFDELTERLAGAYVHVKYRNPEMLAQMEAIIDNMPPGEAKAFYEAAAPRSRRPYQNHRPRRRKQRANRRISKKLPRSQRIRNMAQSI